MLRHLARAAAAARPRLPAPSAAWARAAASGSGFYGPRQRAIEARLTQVFAPTHLQVLNESHGRQEDESHFKVIVVSEAFDAKRLIARHRAVNDALLDEAGALPFHSLSIGAAKTPAEWAASAAVPASPQCAGGDGRGMAR